MVHGDGEKAQMKLRISEKAIEGLKMKPPSENTEHIVDELVSEVMAAEDERKIKRAFQAEIRQTRKENLAAAKAADIDLALACEADDLALKAFETDKHTMKALETTVCGFEMEAKQLDDRIKNLQDALNAKQDRLGEAKGRLHEHALLMAAHNPQRTQAKVRELLDASDTAWKDIPSNRRKKMRDRGTKKKAKTISGR